MRKTYVPPALECEVFQLDASIASNCAVVVTNGPEMPGHQQCGDYEDPFAAAYSARSAVYNVKFYEDSCECYTTAGDGVFWTS